MPTTPLHPTAWGLALACAASAPTQRSELQNGQDRPDLPALLRELCSHDAVVAERAAEWLRNEPSAQPFVLGAILGGQSARWVETPALALDPDTCPPNAALAIASTIMAGQAEAASCIRALEELGPRARPALPLIEQLVTELRAPRGPRDKARLKAAPRVEAIAEALRAAGPVVAAPELRDVAHRPATDPWATLEGDDPDAQWQGLCALLRHGSDQAWRAHLRLFARSANTGAAADLVHAIHLYAHGRALRDPTMLEALEGEALARELRWCTLARQKIPPQALRQWLAHEDARVRAAAVLALDASVLGPPAQAIADRASEVQAVVAAIRAHRALRSEIQLTEFRTKTAAYDPADRLDELVDQAAREVVGRQGKAAAEVLMHCSASAIERWLDTLSMAPPNRRRLDVAIARAANDARTLDYVLRAIQVRSWPRDPKALGAQWDARGARLVAERLRGEETGSATLALLARAGSLRASAREVLAPVLIAQTRQTPSERRGPWLQALRGALGEGDATWIALLRDPLTDLRRLALTARKWTFEGEQARAAPVVLALRNDSDSAVAAAAQRLLPAALGADRALELWQAEWPGMTPAARTAVLQSLAVATAGSTEQALGLAMRELGATVPELRTAAVFAICARAPEDPTSGPALRSLFSAPENELLRVALRTLPPELTRRAWPSLLAAAERDDAAILALLPRLLVRAENATQRAEATAALLPFVGHRDRAVQWQAQQALTKLGQR